MQRHPRPGEHLAQARRFADPRARKRPGHSRQEWQHPLLRRNHRRYNRPCPGRGSDPHQRGEVSHAHRESGTEHLPQRQRVPLHGGQQAVCRQPAVLRGGLDRQDRFRLLSAAAGREVSCRRSPGAGRRQAPGAGRREHCGRQTKAGARDQDAGQGQPGTHCRRTRHFLGRNRAAGPGGPAPASTEDGSRRPAGRWCRSRLQQSADGHSRQYVPGTGEPACW